MLRILKSFLVAFCFSLKKKNICAGYFTRKSESILCLLEGHGAYPCWLPNNSLLSGFIRLNSGGSGGKGELVFSSCFCSFSLELVATLETCHYSLVGSPSFRGSQLFLHFGNISVPCSLGQYGWGQLLLLPNAKYSYSCYSNIRIFLSGLRIFLSGLWGVKVNRILCIKSFTEVCLVLCLRLCFRTSLK